jgi:hypothetical protein
MHYLHAFRGGKMTDTILPMHVDRRLIQLSKELDSATSWLCDAEEGYMAAKTAHDLAAATNRMRIKQRMIENGEKPTVQEVEDRALIATREELTELNACEGIVKAARANSARLRVQIDIARSVGASVRAAMDVG